MQYEGHVANGVVVLDGDTDLPEGTRVVVMAVSEVQPQTIADRFQNVIGKATSLPEDMAAQHDHYIHGSPKMERPAGANPVGLLRMAGTIPVAECVEMEAAINRPC